MFYFAFKIPAVKKAFDIDICLDTGLCAQGLEINTQNGLIKINEENCLKYSWKWNAKNNYCKISNTKFRPKEIIYE